VIENKGMVMLLWGTGTWILASFCPAAKLEIPIHMMNNWKRKWFVEIGLEDAYTPYTSPFCKRSYISV